MRLLASFLYFEPAPPEGCLDPWSPHQWFVWLAELLWNLPWWLHYISYRAAFHSWFCPSINFLWDYIFSSSFHLPLSHFSVFVSSIFFFSAISLSLMHSLPDSIALFSNPFCKLPCPCYKLQFDWLLCQSCSPPKIQNVFFFSIIRNATNFIHLPDHFQSLLCGVLVELLKTSAIDSNRGIWCWSREGRGWLEPVSVVSTQLPGS